MAHTLSGNIGIVGINDVKMVKKRHDNAAILLILNIINYIIIHENILLTTPTIRLRFLKNYVHIAKITSHKKI